MSNVSKVLILLVMAGGAYYLSQKNKEKSAAETPEPVQQESEWVIPPSYESAQAASQTPQEHAITVGTVTIMIPDGYVVKGRQQLQDGGDTCLICPEDNPDNDRLIVKIHPGVLEGIDGLTSEEVGDMLYRKVDDLAGVLANPEKSGLKLDNKYKVYYDDNANGQYFPHSYSYVNGTSPDGKRTLSYTQATLVNGIIVSGTAIATEQGELNALSEILSDIVMSAAE